MVNHLSAVGWWHLYVCVYLIAHGGMGRYRELLNQRQFGGEYDNCFEITGTSYSDIHDVMKDPSRSLCICPGGFSESVFADCRDDLEYSYMKDRLGFIRMAIWYQRDIVPVYQFGNTGLYYTVRAQRALRARLTQRFRVPMVAWAGMLITNQVASSLYVPSGLCMGRHRVSWFRSPPVSPTPTNRASPSSVPHFPWLGTRWIKSQRPTGITCCT